MNIRYHVEGHVSASVRNVVERETRFLDVRLATFADDLKSLDVTINPQPHDDSYVSKLVLRLPSGTIAATGEGEWRLASLRTAFDALRDQLDEHLAKLRGEPAIRRAGKRTRGMASASDEAVEPAQRVALDGDEELVYEGMDRND